MLQSGLIKQNELDMLDFGNAHPEWHAMLKEALLTVDKDYLLALKRSQDWLPGIDNIFSAFTIPLNQMHYILLGESPYPRAQSANGYAFWDSAVHQLWSSTGLSREVNRATSLRNWIKMLLLARGDLHLDYSQAAIAALDKSAFWQTGEEFFSFLLRKGFLLLNASLVYKEEQVPFHARQWQPFIECLFEKLALVKPHVQLILLGRIAERIPQATRFPCLIAEHPYNISFINNEKVLQFFKPLDLLKKS